MQSASAAAFIFIVNILVVLCMIRINDDLPAADLQDIKVGDLVTDTFSKTGLVESIEINDDGLYRIYAFHLVTGRTIEVKR